MSKNGAVASSTKMQLASEVDFEQLRVMLNTSSNESSSIDFDEIGYVVVKFSSPEIRGGSEETFKPIIRGALRSLLGFLENDEGEKRNLFGPESLVLIIENNKLDKHLEKLRAIHNCLNETGRKQLSKQKYMRYVLKSHHNPDPISIEREKGWSEEDKKFWSEGVEHIISYNNLMRQPKKILKSKNPRKGKKPTPGKAKRYWSKRLELVENLVRESGVNVVPGDKGGMLLTDFGVIMGYLTKTTGEIVMWKS